MSFLNGLSLLGSNTAQYAATAGLEAQKADLARQSLTLADQLATNRELNVTQPFAASQQAASEAGANSRNAASIAGSQAVAGIQADSSQKVASIGAGAALGAAQIAANADAGLRAAQANEANARASLTSSQSSKVDAITGIQNQIANEYSQPTPDTAKIKALTNQVTAYSTDAQTQGAIMTSLASMSASSQVELTRLTAARDTELNAMSGIQFDDALRAQKQAAVDGLNQQIAVAKARADAYSDQASAFVSNRANLPQPGAGGAGNGAPVPTGAGSPSTSSGASTAPTGAQPQGKGLLNGGIPAPSAAAPDNAAPTPAITGSVGPAATAPISSPSSTATATPAAGTTSTAAAKLPGEVGNATNIDVLKAVRPDLNIDALQGKSPAAIGIIMQIVEGRATLPPLGSRSPDAMMIRALASQVDPTLDEATSKSRMETRQYFTGGGQGASQITKINTALGHAGAVSDAFDALHNGSNVPINWAANGISSAIGNPNPGNAQMAVNALAAEARSVFAGGGSGGTLEELKEWKEGFPINGSQIQQKQALSEFVGLLNSRLQSLGNQYNSGMNTTGDPLRFLQPHAQAVFEKLTGSPPDTPVGLQLGTPRAGATPPASQAAVAAPSTAELQRLWGQ